MADKAKKPTRKADAMGKDRKASSDAKFKVASKIMDIAFDTKGTRADAGKKKLGGLYKGAKLNAWDLYSESNKLSSESERIKKAGSRMAKASEMRKANLDKMKKKK